MGLIEGKRVLIGITGGIAVYKIADLVRMLRREGAHVKIIMTPFATKFVGTITFETLSSSRVYTDWSEDPLAHINLARWAQTFLIAPCTVNTLSKLAMGEGDNLLTTTALAYDGPLIVAPAANTVMLSQKVVRRNLDLLVRDRSAVIVSPEYGVLACEEEGEGKLASPLRLFDHVVRSLYPKVLQGKRILITAGSTREYLDPVRYISNDSSGKMGFALARVARWLGADVKVVAGFTTAEEPPEVDIFRVQTCDEMMLKVLELLDWADAVIMNAAVSDYRPKTRSVQKIKKMGDITIDLERNPDILEEIGTKKKNQVVVGFSLESENLVENAKEKLRRKNLDLIVANPVEVMGSDHHRGFLVSGEGVEEFEFSDKIKSAEFILNRIAEFLKVS